MPGSTGIAPTLEETSLALTALAGASGTGSEAALSSGTEWLLHRLESPALPAASPIGLYFAKLWYYEKLYPLIFAADALGHLR